MNNRKGFTLVELLGIIVVLGIVASIAIVVVTSVINSSKEKTYELNEKNILNSAVTYTKESDDGFYIKPSSTDLEYKCVTVQELIDLGYFKNDILESKILNNDDVISVTPEMTAYIERNKYTKVYLEEHLIKSNQDPEVINCNYISTIACPLITSYDGIYDSSEHTITVSNPNEIVMRYKTEGSNIWTKTLPVRVDAGTTSIIVQAGDEFNRFKSCSNASITIRKKEVDKPDCIQKEYNGSSQILLNENPVESSSETGYWNSKIEGINAGNYSTTINLNSNYKWKDNTEGNIEKTCSITRKPIRVSWANTNRYFNNSLQGPTASANTGVTGEAMELSATKESSVGTHSSTASCNRVTGGQETCENYTLENTTTNFTINRTYTKTTYKCQSSNWSSGTKEYVYPPCTGRSKSYATQHGLSSAINCVSVSPNYCLNHYGGVENPNDSRKTCYEKTTYYIGSCTSWQYYSRDYYVSDCKNSTGTWTKVTCS